MMFGPHRGDLCFATGLISLCTLLVAPEFAYATPANAEEDASETELPWDYLPYRVLILIASDNPAINAAQVDTQLREFLDRDFSAIWRTDLADAPPSLQSIMFRDLDGIDYETFIAADPVLAIKRDHKDASKIRAPANVAEFVTEVLATDRAIASLKEQGQRSENPKLDGIADRLTPVDGDSMDVARKWAEASTQGMLLSRGLAMTLREPEAKLIRPPVKGLLADRIESYDKVFLVRVQTSQPTAVIDCVEIDVLVRFFGSVVNVTGDAGETVAQSIGQGLVRAFGPVVRIEDAGQKSAKGLLRAGGLIVDPRSPAKVNVGDVLMPAVRKDDRNGEPFLVGPMEWAYLVCEDHKDGLVQMGFFAGRTAGLQGRKNNRTHRVAIKVTPVGQQTRLRLHAKGDSNFPLIGYEIYERGLDSKDFVFVGRTDWNGRLDIEKRDEPLRLMYVKNGGAVLAKLPMVPGLNPTAVADIGSDDIRLEAESYIRGVQNSIVDLVAVRELFKARIMLRLKKGEMEKATELMDALREQPSNEELANEMGKRQAAYLKILGKRNANQKRAVEKMFSTTREMLGKHINPKLIRDLDSMMVAAKSNGGKLPPRKDETTDDEDQ